MNENEKPKSNDLTKKKKKFPSMLKNVYKLKKSLN